MLALFYADDGYLASRREDVLQEAMDTLVSLFERVGLITNTSKTVSMTCVPGKIRTQQSERVYKNARCGFYTEKEWNRRTVECDICQKVMQARSLAGQLEAQHDVYRSRVIDMDLTIDRYPVICRARQSITGT